VPLNFLKQGSRKVDACIQSVLVNAKKLEILLPVPSKYAHVSAVLRKKLGSGRFEPVLMIALLL
jgi:hypothetical protein